MTEEQAHNNRVGVVASNTVGNATWEGMLVLRALFGLIRKHQGRCFMPGAFGDHVCDTDFEAHTRADVCLNMMSQGSPKNDLTHLCDLLSEVITGNQMPQDLANGSSRDRDNHLDYNLADNFLSLD
jgi:hypothetical protein